MSNGYSCINQVRLELVGNLFAHSSLNVKVIGESDSNIILLSSLTPLTMLEPIRINGLAAHFLCI